MIKSCQYKFVAKRLLVWFEAGTVMFLPIPVTEIPGKCFPPLNLKQCRLLGKEEALEGIQITQSF